MSDAADTKKLMTQALAVKRGETALTDLPEAQQAKVRKVLKSTPDNKMRVFAESQAPPRTVRVAQRAPQQHFRRARCA